MGLSHKLLTHRSLPGGPTGGAAVDALAARAIAADWRSVDGQQTRGSEYTPQHLRFAANRARLAFDRQRQHRLIVRRLDVCVI